MRTWSTPEGRSRTVMAVIAAVTVIVLIALNLCATLLPYSATHLSLDEDTTFNVSQESLSWLDGIKEDVTLSFVCEGGRQDADPDLYAFLSRYAAASDRITLRVLDPARDRETLADLGATELSDLSVIVEGKGRVCLLDNTQLYYYLNSTYQMVMSPAEYEETLAQCNEIDTTGEFAKEFAATTVPYFDGEFYLTNAINYVTCEKLSIAYTLTGCGAVTLDASLLASLSLDCYEHRTLSSLSKIPDDCDVLIIYAPESDLSEAEALVLSDYLADGGRLLLSTNYESGVLSNLESVLRAYGMSFGDTDAIVCDGENTPYTGFFAQFLGMMLPDPFVSYLTASEIFDGVDGITFLNALSHPLTVTPTEGVTVEALLKTSEKGYLVRYDEDAKTWKAETQEVDGEEEIVYATHCVGATAKKGETEILWISGATSLFSLCNAYSGAQGNFTLVSTVLDEMTQNTNTVMVISAKPFDVTAFSPTSGQRSLWGVLLAIVIPLVPAIIGAAVVVSKRRR